ncbi:hypothetical protein ACHAXT_006592 [Thalassiosira profunda]
MAADSIEGSLERLRVDGGDSVELEKGADSAADAASRSAHDVSRATPSPPHRPHAVPMLLCDAGYGFPTQARPRKERINAVSRQICNFLEWRSSSEAESHCCNVSLLGAESDVGAVGNRMSELEKRARSAQSANNWTKGEVDFQCDVPIDAFLEQQSMKEDAVYLSPDASETLLSTRRPPRAVIVGMLIDRRVTTDRSRLRAEETLQIRAAKLPLDELNVKELTSNEPLNVDTVMELMQRWWWLAQRCEKSSKDDEIDSVAYQKCFLEAAAYAMKTQRERHPNRTIHNKK